MQTPYALQYSSPWSCLEFLLIYSYAYMRLIYYSLVCDNLMMAQCIMHDTHQINQKN